MQVELETAFVDEILQELDDNKQMLLKIFMSNVKSTIEDLESQIEDLDMERNDLEDEVESLQDKLDILEEIPGILIDTCKEIVSEYIYDRPYKDYDSVDKIINKLGHVLHYEYGESI